MKKVKPKTNTKHTLVTVRQPLESRNWLGLQCLINTHCMKKASDYYIVTCFHLWPLSTSETFSSAAIIMYKSYLELENNWISYRFCFFFCVHNSSERSYSQKWLGLLSSSNVDSGYILVLSLYKYSLTRL